MDARRRTRRAPFEAVAFLLSLGPVACALGPAASPVVPHRSLRAATLDEVLAAYDGYCKGMETLSAAGDLDLRDYRAGKTQRLAVRLVARRGGRLYLKGSVAVVTAVEVVSDGERFWFAVPSKKTVWTGAAAGAAPREAGGERAPYYALRPRDITWALLPEPMSPGEGQSLSFEGDGSAFSLSLARLAGGRGIVERRVWVERETLRPLRARSYDERGEVSTEASFGLWTDGRPRQVVVKRPEEGYEATFSLDKFETNVAVPERAFLPRTPEGYKVVEVED